MAGARSQRRVGGKPPLSSRTFCPRATPRHASIALGARRSACFFVDGGWCACRVGKFECKTPELTVDQREHESGQREAAQSQRGGVGEPPVVDWESRLALFDGGGDEVMVS